MSGLQEITDNLQDKAPEIVKQNKGALLGAVIGYFISDNEKAKSVLLSAVAGALLVDRKHQVKDEE